MHRRTVSGIVLAFTLASIMFKTGSADVIARNRVWFEVYHSYGFGTREDVVMNTPYPRALRWGFHIENWKDETGQSMINPNVKVFTDVELVDFWPLKPAIQDGIYEWQFAELPEGYAISGGAREPNFSDYSPPGFSAKRQVSPEILVDPVTIQNLSLTLTFEALPADVTGIDINIGVEKRLIPSQEEQLVNYTVLSIRNAKDWSNHDSGWTTSPSSVLLGNTYIFEAELEVVKSPKLEGVITSRPGIQIVYYHWDDLSPTIGSSATVVHPEGLRVTLSAEGEFEWGTSLSYSRQDFWFEPVVARPSPPIANFGCDPEISWVNELMTFNASASSSSYNLTSYRWDFGDRNITTATVPIKDHSYGREGRYTVALNVTDIYDLWNATSYNVTVTFTTDLNKDCTVNILDIFPVAMAFGSKPGDQNWNAIADLDKSGIVDILDIFKIAWDYGKTV